MSAGLLRASLFRLFWAIFKRILLWALRPLKVWERDITIKNGKGKEYDTGLCEISADIYKLRVWITDFKDKLSIESTNNVHGAILVFDINDRISFNKLPEFMDFISAAGIRHVLLIGNKCDVAGTHRITDVDIDNFKGRYSQVAIDFVTVSAKTCENMSCLFMRIANIGFNAADFDGKFTRISILRADYKSKKITNGLSAISVSSKREGVKFTTHVKEGRNPEWKETFTIPITAADTVIFEATAVSKDPVMCDPIELQGAQILSDKRIDMTLPMHKRKALHFTKEKGSLHVAFEPGYRRDSCHKLEFAELGETNRHTLHGQRQDAIERRRVRPGRGPV